VALFSFFFLLSTLAPLSASVDLLRNTAFFSRYFEDGSWPTPSSFSQSILFFVDNPPPVFPWFFFFCPFVRLTKGFPSETSFYVREVIFVAWILSFPGFFFPCQFPPVFSLLVFPPGNTSVLLLVLGEHRIRGYALRTVLLLSEPDLIVSSDFLYDAPLILLDLAVAFIHSPGLVFFLIFSPGLPFLFLRTVLRQILFIRAFCELRQAPWVNSPLPLDIFSLPMFLAPASSSGSPLNRLVRVSCAAERPSPFAAPLCSPAGPSILTPRLQDGSPSRKRFECVGPVLAPRP